MFFVYVLKCNDGTFYKGLTCDVEKRLFQHRVGQCDSTKHKDPELVFVQVCEDRNEARVLEKYLKSGIGREIINELLS